MFEVDRITALVCDWSIEGQSLGLWQKHCHCKGDITILCCKGGWKIVFMSSRFNNDAQRRYSPIEGECLTLFWAINKADFFIYGIYGCDIYWNRSPAPFRFFQKTGPKTIGPYQQQKASPVCCRDRCTKVYNVPHRRGQTFPSRPR